MRKTFSTFPCTIANRFQCKKCSNIPLQVIKGKAVVRWLIHCSVPSSVHFVLDFPLVIGFWNSLYLICWACCTSTSTFQVINGSSVVDLLIHCTVPSSVQLVLGFPLYIGCWITSYFIAELDVLNSVVSWLLHCSTVPSSSHFVLGFRLYTIGIFWITSYFIAELDVLLHQP